jgi:hypothetical protein
VQNLVQAGTLALAVAVYGLQSGTWRLPQRWRRLAPASDGT